MTRDVRLLFAGSAAMVVGAFAPWVSVLFFSLSGMDIEYGIVTLIAGLACAAAAYQLWRGGLFVSVAERTVVIIALVAALAGIASPVYVAVRMSESVVSRVSSTPSLRFGSTSTRPSGPFDDGARALSDSLQRAFGPKIGIGIWLSIAGGAAAFAGAYGRSRKRREDGGAPWA
jgi:hypothetical protein